MDFLYTVIRLMIIRCEACLRERGVINSLDKFLMLKNLRDSLKDEDLKRWAYVTSEETDPDDEGLSITEKRYLTLVSRLNGDNVLQSLLDLCLTVFFYPEFDAWLTKNLGYSVNLSLAYLLEGDPLPDEKGVIKKAEEAGIFCNVDLKASPLKYAPIFTDERVCAYISGDDRLSPLLSDYTFLFEPGSRDENEAFINGSLIERGSTFFKEGGKVLGISGSGGRRFIARGVAWEIKRDFLFLKLPDLFRDSRKDGIEKLKSTLIREALFRNAGICFYDIDESFLSGGIRDSQRKRDIELLERTVFTDIFNREIPLILISEEPVNLINSLSDREYSIIELQEKISYDDRVKLWKGFSAWYGFDIDEEDFAVRYQLNASEAAGVLKSFSEIRTNKEKTFNEEDIELFSRISLRRAADQKEMNVGRVIYPKVTLKDVKLKKEISDLLMEVVNSVKKSAMLLEDWKLKDSYHYGRGVSLLMTGPPGTGKTMTANAIAGELKIPLYAVNLSNIVDKYIGETEKNLEAAFTYAEKTNSILFFDEADSLFGTRSEVSDAKDRYANTEVSYLLQRVESYDGIVIMATNIMGNIDPAFMRRIRYVVHYENPDSALRREIWESLLKGSVPTGKLDLDYLSEQFEDFTGSTIKSVFLNACAYAAGLEEELNMKHLIHSIRQELEKKSTVSFASEALGKYAYL